MDVMKVLQEAKQRGAAQIEDHDDSSDEEDEDAEDEDDEEEL